MAKFRLKIKDTDQDLLAEPEANEFPPEIITEGSEASAAKKIVKALNMLSAEARHRIFKHYGYHPLNTALDLVAASVAASKGDKPTK